ncbi:MAG: EamA family transporter, partial [Elainella sp.]
LEPLQWLGVGLTLVSIYLINQREQFSQTLRQWRQILTGQSAESAAIPLVVKSMVESEPDSSRSL